MSDDKRKSNYLQPVEFKIAKADETARRDPIDYKSLYQELLETAEDICQANELAYKRIRTVRHMLIGSRGLAEYFRILVEEMADLDVDEAVVSLCKEAIDPGRPSITSLPAAIKSKLRFFSRDELKSLVCPSGLAEFYIGPVTDSCALVFFGEEIQSCVIAPLIFHDNLIGCLHLGARARDRFPADHSLDLLEDLAVTAAICLDNATTHEQNEQLASTDSLTGIANRRSFFLCSSKAMALSRRHGDDLACIYLDLDDFKPINDEFGHEAGDMVLKKIADHIKTRLRRTDIFARLGGDEFAIMLPRVGLQDARKLALTLQNGIKTLFSKDQSLGQSTVSASFGVAAISSRDETLKDLLDRADQAMYEEKKKRRLRQAKAQAD